MIVKFKKTFSFVILGIALLLGGGALTIWLGQERIITLFVREANRRLRTPVQVGKIEVSLVDAFPRVAVTLHHIVVHGSLPHDTTALARAGTLYCAFNAWDLLAGRYRIRSLTLADGYVQVRHDLRGMPNYAVVRPDSTQATTKPLAFELETIRLKNVRVEYKNDRTQHRYTTLAHDMLASLEVSDSQINIGAEGRLLVNAIHLGNDGYFEGKELQLTTQLDIDRKTHVLDVQPSTVRIGQAAYSVKGRIGYGGIATDWDLALQGQQTNLQALVAVLPSRVAQQLRRYRSQGDVYFQGRVKTMPGRATPRIDVQFGCRNASFYHPEFQESVEHVFLTGVFNNGAEHTGRTAVLTLQNLRGTLHGRPFRGSLRYENLLDPAVWLDLRADVDVARVLRFFPLAAVAAASGQAQVNVAFVGNLRRFRARGVVEKSVGELTLRGVNVQLRDYALPLTGLTGTLLLRRTDVAISNFSGRMGRSDFRLSGVLKNALGWLLLPHQQVLIEATATAQLLDLDQLLGAAAGPPGAGRPVSPKATKASGYGLQVSPNLALNLAATVQHVRFRQFRGRSLRGTVRLHQQVLSTPGLSVQAAGGSATLRGTLDVRQPDLLKASTVMTCTQLPLDSLFYVFEDFGQHFLTARHLRGTLTATAESDVYFDHSLTPLTNRLEAEIQATVRNGELNNFAPLQKLAMVASKEQLRHLRFAQLTNSLYVQSRTVYIPEMEIRSNMRTASVLRVTGTHTFDQQMEYHLSIPLLPGLLHRPTIEGETAFGPVLLLAIQGDEDNFRVSLDRSRGQMARRPTAAPGKNEAQRLPLPDKTAGTAAATDQPAPTKLFEVKKPEKKPAQPQPGQYFDF